MSKTSFIRLLRAIIKDLASLNLTRHWFDTTIYYGANLLKTGTDVTRNDHIRHFSKTEPTAQNILLRGEGGGHSQIGNSILKVDPTSKSWPPPPPPPNLDINVYFWRKQIYSFSHTIVLYCDRTSWNCNITVCYRNGLLKTETRKLPIQWCFPIQQRERDCRKHL